MPARRSSLTNRSCNVPNARSTRPLACGLLAQRISMFSSVRARPNCVAPSPPAASLAFTPEHLSVYETSPELREREAFEEKLEGAPEATGEPGKSSAGDFGRLAVRGFFSAGAGLLAWSHMPVETAQ